LCTLTPETTLYSAACGSAATARLSYESDGYINFRFKGLQRIAGRVADISTLQAAQELELPLCDEVLRGAAEAGSVLKLQWLHLDQCCQLPSNICSSAAKSGSIEVLMWWKDHGSAFTTETCNGTAAGAHMHVLQFLRGEGCEWDEKACSAAAKKGHLSVLQWLHEQGCPWDPEEICGDAAQSGSMEMLLYLKQQGCE
jgi:hypothetical protein